MTEEVKTVKSEETKEEVQIADMELLQEMAEAGVLFGRKKTKTHPRMKRFIFITRNGSEILDLEKTIKYLEKAGEVIKSLAQKKAVILFVGTTPAAKELVKNLAEKYGFPYVTERWLGGTITNFKTLSKRLQYFIKLKNDREMGRLAKYTKKEQSDFDKEIIRMTPMFGGLEKLERVPDALFVVGSTSHQTAIREARRMDIPVISILSSDANPEEIQYPIPANDRARSSIAWILSVLEKKIIEGKNAPIVEVSREAPQEKSTESQTEENKVQ